jgi:hypothetical protein
MTDPKPGNDQPERKMPAKRKRRWLGCPGKGTHYHEEESRNRKLSPEAQWIKDGGWSGKR